MAHARVTKPEMPMPPAAIGITLFAFFSFSFLDASAKWLVTGGYAVMFVVWVRFFVQAFILFVFYRGWRNARLWQSQRPVLQLVRSAALPGMTMFNFLALQSLQLSETVSVLLATPIMVAVLAGPILGEWAGPRRWAAICAGFIGVLIVVRPGVEIITLPVIYIVASMLCNCVYLILTRMLAGIETKETLIFYPALFAVLFFAPLAYPHVAMPAAPSHFLIFLVPGLAGMIGHTALIRASTLADTSKIAPFMYTQVIYMAVFGYVLFGDVPDIWTLTGTGVISASGLYLWYRERRLSKARVA